jgi:hypothetical protein
VVAIKNPTERDCTRECFIMGSTVNQVDDFLVPQPDLKTAGNST